MTTYYFTLAFTGLLIVSYLFSLFAGKTKFPSILMLIVLGLAVKMTGYLPDLSQRAIRYLLQIFGTIGLIFIILEAVLDIKVKPENMHIIRKSLATATVLFSATAAALGFFIYFFFDCTPLQAVIYAVPLAVVSSAVAIPSCEHLRRSQRMQVTYETAFSDIIGVLLFNFLIIGNVSYESVGILTLQTMLGLGLSVVVSFVLIFMMTRIQEGAVYALILASLAFLYAMGKILNLPSLILIMVFGVLVNNRDLVNHERLKVIYEHENYIKLLRQLKVVVVESTFVIRTIFFFIFGYSITLQGLYDPLTWLVAISILLIVYSLRYGQVKLAKDPLLPYLAIVPRGLITILLFYSIPKQFRIEAFSADVLTILVFATCITMAVSLIYYDKIRKREKAAAAAAEAEEPQLVFDPIHHLQ